MFSGTIENSIDDKIVKNHVQFENEDYSAKLPPEILLHIFQFISSHNLQSSVALVNKRWHQLVRDPSLLKVLKLVKRTPQPIINVYISQRPLLRVLKARALEFINETIENILKCCTFLVCLDVGFCNLLEESIITICYYGKNLKHINLEGVELSHAMADLLCTYLPQLEILNLSHCENLNDQTMESISEHLNSLLKINIDGIQNISDYGIVALCRNHFNFLTSIWIDGCELTDIGLHALRNCQQLSVLSISYADTFTDNVVLPLRTLSNLKFLSIHKATELSKLALLDLFNKPDSQLTKLISLDLNECSVIDDEILNSILELCGKNLRILSLNWCWNITDDGLNNLVLVAINMERLSLIGNHIIKGTAFQNLVGRWLHLRLLNLTNCNQIDDDLLKTIARQMPETYIFDYFGERFSDFDDNVTQYDISRALELVPICDHV